jgi:putative NAD(P)H nitroreductase
METIQTLKERRSINYFDPEAEISEEQITEIIDIANLSPSSYNLQPWEVVVVLDPGRKEALKRCAYNQQKTVEASAVLIVIANPNAVEENVDRVLKSWVDLGFMKAEEAEANRKAPLRMYGEKGSETRRRFAVKNASLFAMSVMIAAKGLGFETHPMDGFVEDMVKKEFNIPEDRIIPLLIALGKLKPGVKLLPRAFRRGLDEFVKYNNFTP